MDFLQVPIDRAYNNFLNFQIKIATVALKTYLLEDSYFIDHRSEKDSKLDIQIIARAANCLTVYIG